MKVGIFGSEYQIERQNLIKRLFEKLREQEADIYVDSPFYTFLTDALAVVPVPCGCGRSAWQWLQSSGCVLSVSRS